MTVVDGHGDGSAAVVSLEMEKAKERMKVEIEHWAAKIGAKPTREPLVPAAPTALDSAHGGPTIEVASVAPSSLHGFSIDKTSDCSDMHASVDHLGNRHSTRNPRTGSRPTVFDSLYAGFLVNGD